MLTWAMVTLIQSGVAVNGGMLALAMLLDFAIVAAIAGAVAAFGSSSGTSLKND